eukprot:scaffold24073_cov128-Isochrysis_galbana.AAC.2
MGGSEWQMGEDLIIGSPTAALSAPPRIYSADRPPPSSLSPPAGMPRGRLINPRRQPPSPRPIGPSACKPPIRLGEIGSSEVRGRRHVPHGTHLLSGLASRLPPSTSTGGLPQDSEPPRAAEAEPNPSATSPCSCMWRRHRLPFTSRPRRPCV